VKKLLIRLIKTRFAYVLIKYTSICLGYKAEIFESKYFKDSANGIVWMIKSMWFQRVLGFNRFFPYPTAFNVKINSHKNLIIHPDSINNLQSPGCYFQNFTAKIFISKDVYIGPNVGLITCNHDILDPTKHAIAKDIIIDEGVWVGMNVVIMPGVHLKNGIVVAANSVVTSGVYESDMMLAGAPALVKKCIKPE